MNFDLIDKGNAWKKIEVGDDSATPHNHQATMNSMEINAIQKIEQCLRRALRKLRRRKYQSRGRPIGSTYDISQGCYVQWRRNDHVTPQPGTFIVVDFSNKYHRAIFGDEDLVTRGYLSMLLRAVQGRYYMTGSEENMLEATGIEPAGIASQQAIKLRLIRQWQAEFPPEKTP